MSEQNFITSDELQSIVDRIEHLEVEIRDLNTDKSEVYKEARAGGFDVKALRRLIAERRMPTLEREALAKALDLYRDALHGPLTRAREAAE